MDAPGFIYMLGYSMLCWKVETGETKQILVISKIFPRRNVHRAVTEVSDCFICLFCHARLSSTVPAVIDSSVCCVHGQTHMAFKLSCSFKPTTSSCDV